jgi:SHS2 domain-containing protein
MTRYEILPHPADAEFRAYGRSLEEAFGNAALALASLMWDWAKVKPRIVRAVRTEGRDREQLLVNFLGEVLFLLDTESFLLGAVEGLRIRPADGCFRLEARFLGDRLSADTDYEVYGGVKAVTYNEMRIEEGHTVAVQVVVDV